MTTYLSAQFYQVCNISCFIFVPITEHKNSGGEKEYFRTNEKKKIKR